MPYREKRIISGPILEAEIYPISRWEQRQPRARKLKQTRKAQRLLNRKNAIKHLIRLLNCNFTRRDISLTLTYAPGNLPGSLEQAMRDVRNYIRRVNRWRDKRGMGHAQYIAVVEYREETGCEGKSIRIHHHVVMSGMDRDEAERIWRSGRANADRLQPDQYGLEALARYISKDPKGRKRWMQSKGLRQPEIRVNDSRITRARVERIWSAPEDREEIERMYPGYRLLQCVPSVNDFTGKSISIKLRRINFEEELDEQGHHYG